MTDQETALRADNPRSRHHHEERPNGWASWACIPVTDAIEAALAAPPVARLDVDAFVDSLPHISQINNVYFHDPVVSKATVRDWLRAALAAPPAEECVGDPSHQYHSHDNDPETTDE